MPSDVYMNSEGHNNFLKNKKVASLNFKILNYTCIVDGLWKRWCKISVHIIEK